MSQTVDQSLRAAVQALTAAGIPEAGADANAKFVRRFEHIEQRLAAKGSSPAQSDLAEMDALWNEARHKDKARSG